MAPPPREKIGGESTSGESQRSIPTPFLTKTYQLVDDPSINDIISWNDDGTTFVVWKPAEFARDILPNNFKHNNFSSFVRQLNTYGFRKVIPDRWEFSNDCFIRGDKRLLRDIQRRKFSSPVTVAAPVTVAIAATIQISPSTSGEEQVISSNSSPVATALNPCIETNCGDRAELVDENERLRKENQQLNTELTRMKSLCNNIYHMMAICGNSNIAVAKPLDLFMEKRFFGEAEVQEREASPKLFGVTIGTKRAREECGLVTPDHDNFLRLKQPSPNNVKSELFDQNQNDVQESQWLEQRSRSNNQTLYN